MKNNVVNFNKNGFVILKNVINKKEVHSLFKEIEIIKKEALKTKNKRYFHLTSDHRINTIHNIQKFYKSKKLLRLSKNQKILKFLKSVLSKNIFVRNFEFFLKPAKTGMASPPHQDNFFWNIADSKAANVWIALSNSNKKNGGIYYLKGSQKFLEVPTLTLDSSQNPISSISQSSNGTDERSNKFILTVTDGDEVGSFNWSVTSKNLAGILTTSVSPASYNIQGFSERTLTATKDSLAQGLSNNIGVSVFDPSNLSFENLSKGGSAQNGGTIFTYKSFSAGTKMDFLVNFTNQFTVCDSDGTFNPNGEYLFNLDKLNRDSNSDKNNPAQFIVRED